MNLIEIFLACLVGRVPLAFGTSGNCARNPLVSAIISAKICYDHIRDKKAVNTNQPLPTCLKQTLDRVTFIYILCIFSVIWRNKIVHNRALVSIQWSRRSQRVDFLITTSFRLKNKVALISKKVFLSESHFVNHTHNSSKSEQFQAFLSSDVTILMDIILLVGLSFGSDVIVSPFQFC